MGRFSLETGVYSAAVGLVGGGAVVVAPDKIWIGYALFVAAFGILIWGARIDGRPWWKYRRKRKHGLDALNRVLEQAIDNASPDLRVPVAEALAFIVLREWGKTMDDAANHLADGVAVAEVLRRFEQAAYEGRFVVWGRRGEVGMTASELEERVPSSHWESHQLNYLPTHILGDAQTEARLPRLNGTDQIYSSLRIDPGEFATAFPPQR